jgi:hypothetical protein
MAKRKPSIRPSQRDKSVIEAAKLLKKAGILSKQTKLHSGKYVSRGVLAKVRQFQHVAALDYIGVKVDKKTLQAAKERGYQVANGRVIGPKNTEFKKRISSGVVTGIKPVKGGFMEEVILPHTVMDMYALVEQLETGIDTYKMPHEQFAFKFYGVESRRAFRDSAHLLEWLKHYKSIFSPNGSLKAEDLQEEFDALTIFRLHPNDVSYNIRSGALREKQRKEKIARGEGRTYQRRSLSEKLADMDENRAKRIRARMAKRSQEQREKRAADPAKYEEYKAKARERAARSYDKRKPK